MFQDMIELIQTRWDFFLQLLGEHLRISMIAIFCAMAIGLFIGILISEYQKSSKIVIGLVNFLSTIPSISLLGFLIPLSGIGDTTAIIALTRIRPLAYGTKHPHGTDQCRPFAH